MDTFLVVVLNDDTFFSVPFRVRSADMLVRVMGTANKGDG